MAELQFFTGTMDSGKSTLALQTNHNHAARGRIGRIFTTHDRAGEALISSRLGLTHDALEVDDGFDFWRYVVDELTHGARIDYLICDEAQFYTGTQIEQLAKIVDELQIDVFAFGILTRLPDRAVRGLAAAGRARRPDERAPGRGAVLVRQARHPQRPHRQRRDGHRGRGDRRRRRRERRLPAEIAYEVLCRAHHRRRMTAARARAISMVAEPLPFA